MMDPEAAQKVFESVEAPVTILPWETCDDQAFRITLVCAYLIYFHNTSTRMLIFLSLSTSSYRNGV